MKMPSHISEIIKLQAKLLEIGGQLGRAYATCSKLSRMKVKLQAKLLEIDGQLDRAYEQVAKLSRMKADCASAIHTLREHPSKRSDWRRRLDKRNQARKPQKKGKK